MVIFRFRIVPNFNQITMRKPFSLFISFVVVALLLFLSWNTVKAQDKIDIGFWTQAWYQHVENGKNGGGLNEFMLRRAYLSIQGQPTDYLSFFSHIAVDRLGQEGLSDPSMGLGSGLAFRDLWITLELNESFKIQAGRMYVPLTRNYGTTSTKSLLTTDLSFLQGGIRGTIFYTSKVGRDDGVTLWGNPFNGRLQYRVMISEGLEDSGNPEDNLRFVGRVAVNLLEPEKGWFNQGTYLGRKKILSFGAGIDSQSNLTLNDESKQDNFIWTIDGFFDHPLGVNAVTLESAYIHIRNSTQGNSFAQFVSGDDCSLFYLQGGYYLGRSIGPGFLQPYFRYETAAVEQKNDTRFFSGGLNYYLKGHNAKVSLDYSLIDHSGSRNQSIVTMQLALGI